MNGDRGRSAPSGWSHCRVTMASHHPTGTTAGLGRAKSRTQSRSAPRQLSLPPSLSHTGMLHPAKLL